jgi:hypothetical protein
MAQRYAMIRGGVVENVVLWDGESAWSPGPDWFVLDCPEAVGPGWTYDNSDFSPPPQPEPEPEPSE